MKCTHCGSQWNSNTAVTECPFCHNPLNAPAGGSKTLTSVLAQLRDQMGVEVLGKGKALISGFKDLAPELKKEHNMLTHLEKCGGIKTLYAAKDKTASEQQLAVSKVLRTMADEYALQESVAQSVCQTYMLVLTGKEKEAQKPNSEADLVVFRQKLTEQLREQVPAQMAAAAKTPGPAPKPAAPAAPPKSAISEFQTDKNGTLLKYNGNASVVRVPDHVKIIGVKAFERNQLITHIILPNGLIGIEQEAFAVCPNLRDVSFPSTLQTIGDKAFWACNALCEVTLPGSVKSIAPLAFWACRGLTKVTLREGITVLGADVFNYCTGLMDINLPKSLKAVHAHAFTGAMDACVSGNSAWTVKDGHVVANTVADTTYRNAGANQKTVIAPPVNQTRTEQPKAANPRTYQNEQPKSPVPPKNPPTTPPKAPVTPKTAPKTTKATKSSNIDKAILTNMWLWIGCAVVLFLVVFSNMGYPEELYSVLPMFAIIFWMGRALLKMGQKVLGGICIFNASVWVTLFTSALPGETWLAVALQVIMVILLTYSGIKHEKKK